jgi:sporulation protein YlmC with PRC-barrel domain
MANDPRDNDINRDPLGASSNAGFGSTSGSAGTSTTGVAGGSSMGAASSGSTGSGSQTGARIEGQSRYENQSGPGPQLMTASTLEGDKVVNRQGEDLGEIDEIMIDVPRGRIAYAVMSSGGFLGMGDKLFAIPWSALTLDTDNKCFVLDVDKQRLENAPGFDKDHWPSMADPQFGSQIHTYYGARPYWE